MAGAQHVVENPLGTADIDGRRVSAIQVRDPRDFPRVPADGALG